MKKSISLCLAVIILLTVLLAFPLRGFTEEYSSLIADAENATVKIAMWIRFYDKPANEKTRVSVSEYFVIRGSGFLVGRDGTSETVVTAFNVASPKALWNPGNPGEGTIEDSLNKIARDNGWVGWEYIPTIAISEDVTISSEILAQSRDMDYAILRLDQPIYTKTSLKLRDSDDMKLNDTVYALGYPGVTSDAQWKASEYQPEDITIAKGSISSVTTLNSIPVFQHSAKLQAGNYGGPLCAEDGSVIGINTWTSAENQEYGYAQRINEIRKTLDGLGIGYLLATGPIGGALTALPSQTFFEMNGIPVFVPQAYNVNDNNYLQLRGIAVLLNGTAAQFNVGWDGTYAVIETGKAYGGTAANASMQPTSNVRPSNTDFKIDGTVITFEKAYLIDGDTNYLQLREVAEKLSGTKSQFNVYWDDKAAKAVIVPGAAYTGVNDKLPLTFL